MSIVVINDPEFPAELYEIFLHSIKFCQKWGAFNRAILNKFRAVDSSLQLFDAQSSSTEFNSCHVKYSVRNQKRATVTLKEWLWKSFRWSV
ncbi:hypothetical protein DdX_14746 [Ditylenchus destructor]|uniref:Uncharacterized protein n=1 Tax=Ditylenchus destructor TaxID=166010 RepID=A0AAD4MWA0_9BILA|nr:hypothetical protein DdX_14746 [Ditylenchus destructor]